MRGMLGRGVDRHLKRHCYKYSCSQEVGQQESSQSGFYFSVLIYSINTGGMSTMCQAASPSQRKGRLAGNYKAVWKLMQQGEQSEDEWSEHAVQAKVVRVG